MAFLNEVTPPLNFGLKFLNAKAHGNIIFKLEDNTEIRVNSIVLAIQSEVFHNLIVNLDQTTIEMEDFAPDAVQYFTEALYTGSVEALNVEIFRDVYKMAHVFGVEWITKRCNVFFGRFLGARGTGYADLLLLFNMASFFHTKLKSPLCLTMFLDHLEETKAMETFVGGYMKDFRDLSTDQLDSMIAIIGPNVVVLVKILKLHLEEVACKLDLNSRHLLNNLNLSMCLDQNEKLHEDLFGMLTESEDITMDDMKMVHKVYRKSIKRDYSVYPVSLVAEITQRTGSGTRISNLFYTFDEFAGCDHRQFKEKLARSPNVKNLYMYFDALSRWLRKEENTLGRYKEEDLFNIREIESVKEYRGWSPVLVGYIQKWKVQVFQYLGNDNTAAVTKFVEILIQTNTLTTTKGCHMFTSAEMYPENLSFFFSTSSDAKKNIVFLFEPSASPRDCTMMGKCAIVLEITPLYTNSHNFDIRLASTCEVAGLHFHNDIMAVDDMYLSLQCKEYTHCAKGRTFRANIQHAISWGGKPKSDQAGNVSWKDVFICKSNTQWNTFNYQLYITSKLFH